ncbi:putative glycoside hydrolase, partial [Bacillus paranthracis]
LLMQSVNLSYQEDGRGFNWRAKSAVSLSYLTPEPLDSKFNTGYLELKMRIDKAPEQGANMQVMCSENHCLRNIDFSSFSQSMADK